MGLESQACRPSGFTAELAAALKRRHPFHTTKLVSQDLGSTLKAAENLLAGHLSGPMLSRLIGAYGPSIIIEAGLGAAGTSLDQFIRDEALRAQQEQRRWEGEVHHFAELEAQLLSRAPPGGSEPGRMDGREAQRRS